MKIFSKNTLFLLIFSIVFSELLFGQTENPVAWLSDFTEELPAGNYLYKYSFNSLNDNPCYLKITEQKTNKKGVSSYKSYVFYLSDINPNTLNFKTTGKYITISVETNSSFKFIKEYDGDEFSSYTSSINIYNDKVDKSREFINSLKQHISECEEDAPKWESTEFAMEWIASNIGIASKGSVEYNQKLSPGNKSYLVKLVQESTNGKGTTDIENFEFNLTDIEVSQVAMNIYGKTLIVELPMKNKEKLVGLTLNNELQNYRNSVEIYMDDLDKTRKVISAFQYLATNLKVKRKEYTDGNEALKFIQDNLTVENAGSYEYKQVLNFDNDPDAISDFEFAVTDSKGQISKHVYGTYLGDLIHTPELSISGKNISIILNTTDKNKFIKVTKDGSLQPYTDKIELYAANIEAARELMNAMKYAIEKRSNRIMKFNDIQTAANWISSNIGKVTIDDDMYIQSLKFNPDIDYKITCNQEFKNSSGTKNITYELYPEDISKEELEINVYSKKLYLKVTTGSDKYIRTQKDGELENYSSDIELYFDDTRTIQNFKAALEFIESSVKPNPKTQSEEKAAMNKFATCAQTIWIGGTLDITQKAENMDDEICKLKLTINEPDTKGGNTELIYEMLISDLDPNTIQITISGNKCGVSLTTVGKQKLIKKYKNGEPQNFLYSTEYWSTDIYEAREMIEALKYLVKVCK